MQTCLGFLLVLDCPSGEGHSLGDSQLAIVVESPPAGARAGRLGVEPWGGKIPPRQSGCPLQDSGLENPGSEGPGGLQPMDMTYD